MSSNEESDFFDMDLTTHRYPNRWNEDNWEEEFEQHPLFMTKQPANNELPPLVEAFQQLKYDENDNTKEELANNYKEDGNLNFKVKKYQNAINCYTAAIKLKSDSKELNSILYANRSAANYHLENYRSSLLDALRSVELNLSNSKAIQRVIQCLIKLDKYEELIKFCDNNLDHIPNVDKIRKDAEEKLKVKQRDQRKSKLKERKQSDAIIDYQNQILKELIKRDIKFKKDNLFNVVHPAAANSKVLINQSDQSLSFPVLFVYPEIAMCDFIEKFNENEQFYQHLITMLDDENNLPQWNLNRMFTSDNVTVKFKINENDEILACTKPPEIKDEVGIHTKSKVEITLGDCLACSGCITSAETVLIQQQSDKQIYQVIEDNKNLPKEERKVIVVSLSLQAITSIAVKNELTFQDTAERLSAYFRSIGIDYVFDISFARHLALYESQRQMIKRFKDDNKLCLLSSVCPGFVCYVEKTHGELLTNLLSTVKSPQQIFGTLLKQFWSIQNQIDIKQIFHISLMPCFDKKLEASRKEFIIENEQHEVDCVITPIELENMFLKDNCNLNEIEPIQLDNFLKNFTKLQQLNQKFNSDQIKSHLGSGSGGYAENIFRMISAIIFDQKISLDDKLNFEMKRNKDYLELDLKIQNKIVFSIALINGFRNIQTLIQRMRRGTCKYNYVEVMACPSGCLNGGGLLRDVSFEIVNKIYSDLPKQLIDQLEQDFQYLYSQWFDNDDRIHKYLHTSFNIIPKVQNSISINW